MAPWGMTEISILAPWNEQLYLLGTIAGGIGMGVWFDLIVGERGNRTVALGAAALGLGIVCGQEWAGIALGCLLASRVVPRQPSQG